MPAKSLTNTALDRLKPRASRYDIKDSSGLIVRVEPSGTITFYSLYRLHGKRRLLKHGEYGPHRMSLAKAREAHAKAIAQVQDARNGEAVDPAAQRDVKKASAKLDDTISAFAETYLDLYAKKTKRTWRADERMLNSDVLPYIGSYKLKDLSRANIQAVLDRIDRRGSQNQAWQTLKIIRKMLNYAVSRGALEVNPAAKIEREATYRAKQRALSDKELEGLFRAIDDLKMQGPLRDLMLFQLLTAVRPSEARLAQWHEIDLEARRWVIPGARMKNGQDHLVPLSSFAASVLDRMQPKGGALVGFVFAGEKEASPFNLQAVGHALRRKVNKQILEMEKVTFFTPHDIRRTAATIMRRLGYGLVVDRVLAHSPTTVMDRHYDVHDYEQEKRAALDGLANHILAIQAKARGENVEPVDFKQKRAGRV